MLPKQGRNRQHASEAGPGRSAGGTAYTVQAPVIASLARFASCHDAGIRAKLSRPAPRDNMYRERPAPPRPTSPSMPKSIPPRVVENISPYIQYWPRRRSDEQAAVIVSSPPTTPATINGAILPVTTAVGHLTPAFMTSS